jgi:hypothetical protein
MKILSICTSRIYWNDLPADIIQRNNSPLKIRIWIAHGVQEIRSDNNSTEHALIISYTEECILEVGLAEHNYIFAPNKVIAVVHATVTQILSCVPVMPK